VICHSIAPYTEKQQAPGKASQKFLEKYTGGEFGDEKHKRFIHQRALSLCKFSEGEKVRYRHKTAQIEHICDNFKEVGWDGLTCLYIMLSMDDGASYTMTHHSLLKRMGR
jgi:hypothetical protein